MDKGLLIHDLSEQLDVSPKAIRYYEKIGILQPDRNSANYRVYSEKDLRVLDFIKKARKMNLSFDEIKAIINIKEEGKLPCNKVINLITEKVSELDRHIQEMMEFRNQLAKNLDNFKENYDAGKDGQVCGFIENLFEEK